MFLRRYTRTKRGRTHTYFALVESQRTEAGPRQQVVAHLGELNADQQRRWQRTTVFYNRQGDAQQLRLFPDDATPLPDDPGVVRVQVHDITWTNARRFGDVFLAHWLWQLLHLDAIVDRHVPAGKEAVRPADVVAIEVINRLCTVQRVRLGRALVCLDRSGRSARRRRRECDQGSALPHARPAAESANDHRK